MKKIIIGAAILLAASTGWSQVHGYGSLTCTQNRNPSLEINEDVTGKVDLTLVDFRNLTKLAGQATSYQYAMASTGDGQEVSLEVVPKPSWASACGRCPPKYPDLVPQAYNVKLSVGNLVYDFVCYPQKK